jgi:hypothetical protein
MAPRFAHNFETLQSAALTVALECTTAVNWGPVAIAVAFSRPSGRIQG